MLAPRALIEHFFSFPQQYPFTIKRKDYRHLIAHLLFALIEHEDSETPHSPFFMFDVLHMNPTATEKMGIFDLLNGIFYCGPRTIPFNRYCMVYRPVPRDAYCPMKTVSVPHY